MNCSTPPRKIANSPQGVVGVTPVEPASPAVDSVTKDGARAAMSLADQVVVSGTNFLTLAIVARLCTQSDVGIFHLAWTIIGFLRTAQERMIAAPYLAFVHQPGQHPSQLLGSSLLHQGVFATICGGFMLALAAWFEWSERVPGMETVLLALVLSLPFILLRDQIRAICAAHFDYHIALVVDIFVCLFQLGGIVALAYCGNLTVPLVALVLGLACLIPGLVWVVSHRDRFEIVLSQCRRDWQQNWGYAKWLVIARTVGIGGYFAIPWIVVTLLDEARAGVFATASGLVGLSLMFVMGANNFFQPTTIRAYHEQGLPRMVRTILESVFCIGAVLLAVVGVFALCGGPLLGLIFGPTYASYGTLVTLLSISIFAVSLSITCGNGFAALTKPKAYLWGELAYCLVAVTTAILLIPVWGINGAACGLVAGGIATSTVTFVTLLMLLKKEAIIAAPHDTSCEREVTS
jgi:O-antigen/teichoic acid export membrane protein